REAVEKLLLILLVELDIVAAGLGGVVQPGTLLGDLDVVVIEAERGHVTIAQALDRLEGGRCTFGGGSADHAGREGCEIVVGKAVRFGSDFRGAGWRATEGIGLDGEVPVFSNTGRELDGGDHFLEIRAGHPRWRDPDSPRLTDRSFEHARI